MSEVIGEWKGKLNSIKVCPFESAGSGVKYEMSWIGEVTGRLSGQEIGTDYLAVAPDGNGVTAYYGVVTTSTGETVLVEGHGTTTPTEQGQIRGRIAIRFKTSSSRLAWLNNTSAAFEIEADWSGDLSTRVFSGRYVEWN